MNMSLQQLSSNFGKKLGFKDVDGHLLLAPVVRRDAFYALLFCLAVRVYASFSPRLSRGLTGWVGGVRVGGWAGVGGA